MITQSQYLFCSNLNNYDGNCLRVFKSVVSLVIVACVTGKDFISGNLLELLAAKSTHPFNAVTNPSLLLIIVATWPVVGTLNVGGLTSLLISFFETPNASSKFYKNKNIINMYTTDILKLTV